MIMNKKIFFSIVIFLILTAVSCKSSIVDNRFIIQNKVVTRDRIAKTIDQLDLTSDTLISVEIKNSIVKDMSWINDYPSVESVYIKNSRVVDESTSDILSSIELVVLDRCNVKSLDFLSGIKGLKVLYIIDSKVKIKKSTSFSLSDLYLVDSVVLFHAFFNSIESFNSATFKNSRLKFKNSIKQFGSEGIIEFRDFKEKGQFYSEKFPDAVSISVVNNSIEDFTIPECFPNLKSFSLYSSKFSELKVGDKLSLESVTLGSLGAPLLTFNSGFPSVKELTLESCEAQSITFSENLPDLSVIKILKCKNLKELIFNSEMASLKTVKVEDSSFTVVGEECIPYCIFDIE